MYSHKLSTFPAWGSYNTSQNNLINYFIFLKRFNTQDTGFNNEWIIIFRQVLAHTQNCSEDLFVCAKTNRAIVQYLSRVLMWLCRGVDLALSGCWCGSVGVLMWICWGVGVALWGCWCGSVGVLLWFSEGVDVAL